MGVATADKGVHAASATQRADVVDLDWVGCCCDDRREAWMPSVERPMDGFKRVGATTPDPVDAK